MKKLLLLVAVFGALYVNAQIANGSFENWSNRTFILQAGTVTGIPADTSVFLDPDDWTSSNAISDLDSVGNHIFVTQSTTAHNGTYAIQMVTDSLSFPQIISGVSVRFPITLPGFVVNGIFNIDPQNLILGGGNTVSPASIGGAGQRITQRLGAINGYYNYTPVFNTNTNANDTCIIWAILRKGTQTVANAILKSTNNTGGYIPFHIPFTYNSCNMPDTVVILMASSVPNVNTIIGGNSKLQRGSVLLVDSVNYELLPVNYIFPPFAANDFDTTLKNNPVTVNVLANDTDCNDNLTVTITRGPANGSVSSNGGNITYTPNTNFLGFDTIWYKDSNSNGDTALAMLVIQVKNNVGINEVSEIPVSVYPVPTANELNINFSNAGKTTARVYDMIGNVVISTVFTSNFNHISTSTLANGFYSIQLVNEQNAIVGHAKFVVSK